MEITKHQEEFIRYEALRILSKVERGMQESPLIRAIQTVQWVDAKAEADADTEMNDLGKLFFKNLRRVPMWKCILRLWNAGHTPAEIAKALKISYSTAYYYCQKFKRREKPRGWNGDLWSIVPETKEFVRKKEPYAKRKARTEAKKMALQRAADKRQRRKERNIRILQGQQDAVWQMGAQLDRQIPWERMEGF